MIRKGLAKAYARALIKSAQKDDSLKRYCEDLRDIAEILASNGELSEILMKPILSSEKRMELLQKLIDKAGVSKIIANLLTVLLQNYRLGYIDQIVRLIEEEIDRREGIIRGEFVCADVIEPGVINRAQDELSRLLGRKIILSPRIQKEIIGGAIIKIGSLEIDGSVLRRINSIGNIKVF